MKNEKFVVSGLLAGKLRTVQFVSTLIFDGGFGSISPSRVAFGNEEQSTACACAGRAANTSSAVANSRMQILPEARLNMSNWAMYRDYLSVALLFVPSKADYPRRLASLG